MKKFLFLILLSPLANADMDKICDIYLEYGSGFMWEQIEDKGCERNNILQVTSTLKRDMPKRQELLRISNAWCRFDRNRDIEGNVLSCVLYSNKQRGDQN